MHFLISVLDDLTGTTSPETEQAIDDFNDLLRANGHWVLAGGLSLPGDSAVIDNRHEKALVVDGPFLESKEFIAGVWIITAPDLETARSLAAQGSLSCDRRVELRPFQGVAD